MKFIPETAAAPSSNRSLILANLIPIFGVLFNNWEVLDIVIFYWIETIIIGIYNVVKIYLAQGEMPKNDEEAAKAMGSVFEWLYNKSGENNLKNKKSTLNNYNTENHTKKYISIFFLIHYNFFILVQFILMIGFIAPSEVNPFYPMELFSFVNDNTTYLLLGILSLIISHGYSLYINYYKGKEYLTTHPSAQMFKPYIRIMIQQFVVIVGAFFLLIFNAPIFLLILLVLFKIVVDLISHNHSHSIRKTSNLS